MRLLHAFVDGNQDGAMDMDEGTKFVRSQRMATVLAQNAHILQNMDTNRDTQLTLEEFKADLQHFKWTEEHKQGLVNRFAHFSARGAEVLSPEEAAVLFSFMFSFPKVDKNGDGLLTRKEFKQIAAPKLQGAPPEEVRKSEAESKTIFAGLDADGDKRLSPAEFFDYDSGIYAGVAALKLLLQLADADRDGSVTAEELVGVRETPGFAGSAAYHHSKDWIARAEATAEHLQKAHEAGEL